MQFKRKMGFFFISFAAGMLCMMFVSNIFWGIVLVCAFSLVGYNMYCD